MISDCHDVFCRSCLQLWLECNGVCPTCHKCVESEEDIMPLRHHMLAVFDLLTICCTYTENGCTQKLKINQIHDDEKTCKFRNGNKKTGPYKKVELYDVSSQHCKPGRLKDMYAALSDFCKAKNEMLKMFYFQCCQLL